MALPWRQTDVVAEPEEEGDDDDLAGAEPVRPETLAFLRGASGRSNRDILKAWDQHKQGTQEERADAVLIALLEASAEPAAVPQVVAEGPKALDIDALDAHAKPSIDLDGDWQVVDRLEAPVEQGGVTEDGALSSILPLFPDMDPEFCMDTLKKAEWAAKPMAERIELAVEHLFGLDGDYKKIQRASTSAKGKRKRSQAEEEAEALKAEEDRYLKRPLNEFAEVEYQAECIEVLLSEFPTMPKPHIVKVAKRNRFWYATTYTALEKELASRYQSFQPLKNARKGKKAMADLPEELGAERTWFHARRENETAIKRAAEEEKNQDAAEEAAGMFIECGCCFTDVPFRLLVQCPEAHLFCQECAKMHCETLLGDRRCDLKCMDAEGCEAEFADEELKRFLDERLLELLARIRQEKAVDAAGLDGLEKCAFCDFACIIEDPDDKLFRCQNEDCLKVFCRSCKEMDHLPLSCEEAKADRAANSLHTVEEAMTAALIRNCPKCDKPFIKQDGCNKMMCSNCHTMSCFVCRQQIKGYEHFKDGQTAGVRAVQAGAQCPLFDDSAVRVHGEVEAARAAAARDVQRVNPSVTQEQLDRLREAAPVRVPGQPYPGQPGGVPAAAPAPGQAGIVQNAYQAARNLPANVYNFNFFGNAHLQQNAQALQDPMANPANRAQHDVQMALLGAQHAQAHNRGAARR